MSSVAPAVGPHRAAAPLAGRHLPALDGLRGIAILLVMACHFAQPPNSGHAADALGYLLLRFGWVGVDLFFVLSGFLITGILYDSRGSAKCFRIFYARRILRIVPLYYAFLTLYLASVPVLFPERGGEAVKLWDGQAWYWTYSLNFLIAQHGSWEVTPLWTSHIWSLALEEQFYLLWPPVVLLLSRRALPYVCGALVCGSLFLRIALVALGVNAHALYVLLPTRVDTLAIGALLAVLAREGEGLHALARGARKLVWPAGALIGSLFIATLGGDASFHPAVQTVGFTALALLFGSVLVLVLTGPPAGPLARICENRSLQALGRYSYALYIFHLPITAILVERELWAVLAGLPWVAAQATFAGSALAASLAMAVMSWHFFEEPILRLRRRFTYELPEAVPSARPAASAT